MTGESKEARDNNKSLCACGSGRPVELCCQVNSTSDTPNNSPDSESNIIKMAFKLGQLYGPAPITPSNIPGKHGAILQFVIPILNLNNNSELYTTLLKKCGEEIEQVSFQPGRQTKKNQAVDSKESKVFGTLVSVTFHYIITEGETGPKKIPQHIGRLIAERFVGLLSFTLGHRVTGLNRQVTRVLDKNRRTVSMRPISSHLAKPIKIELPDEIVDIKISDGIFKAMFWLRRGLVPNDHLAAYGALMVTLEVLAELLVEKTATQTPCPHCAELLDGPKRPSVKKMFTEVLGGEKKLFDRIWKVRNAITAHGNTAVTPEVMQSIVELKLDVLPYVFKALRLACDLPVEGNPRPIPLTMMTDTFMGEE